MSIREEKRGEPNIWVEVCFELRNPDELGWIVHTGDFQCRIDGADDLARSYDLENWESAIKSGLFYIARKANRMPPPAVSIFELSGRLAGQDMVGLTRVAEAGLADQLNLNLPISPYEWIVAVTRSKTF